MTRPAEIVVVDVRAALVVTTVKRLGDAPRNDETALPLRVEPFATRTVPPARPLSVNVTMVVNVSSAPPPDERTMTVSGVAPSSLEPGTRVCA
jgi:hypothetical protein